MSVVSGSNSFTQELSGVDRAILDGETDGFVRSTSATVATRSSWRTIVAEHAGDMIGSLSIAMTHGQEDWGRSPRRSIRIPRRPRRFARRATCTIAPV